MANGMAALALQRERHRISGAMPALFTHPAAGIRRNDERPHGQQHLPDSEIPHLAVIWDTVYT